MPWWSWLVLWVCLGLALIAVLLVSAWRLFRKAMTVFAELGVLAKKTELLVSTAAAAEDQKAEIAVLQKLSDVQARRRLVREASEARRDARHRARLDRAHSLTRFDANTRKWFEAE